MSPREEDHRPQDEAPKAGAASPDQKQRRAEEIFLAVADLPRENWDHEIHQRSLSDTTVVREVRSLLDCHAQADDFLDARELQAANIGFGRLHGDLEDDLRPGMNLGGFQIERLLGRGGMGSVFVAVQDRPRRSVALKIIRRGLATPSLLRRFEHEAEVLGRLHHPGIAQIFEAGMAAAAQGEIPRPFIAMELVNGPPLNTFADARKLSTRDRLELLAKVCDAVHHAHLRGVIHRDLKPGNILVDEQGQPKVLDFGVARAADSDLRVTTMQTSIGQLIGTLPYMSPEQVLADPSEVDTRSDVYALGVVLYQLLTGRLPLDFGSRSIPEAARLIKEETPTKLSHVSKVFRGEVDTIVSKALEKEKARRYQSAADLADDIRRFLRGEAIHAKEDSALYVLRKHLNRYRWAVGVSIVFAMALAAFSFYAAWSAGNERSLALAASAARRDAEDARALVEQANARLHDELAQSNIERGRFAGAMGNVPLAEDVLWAEYFDKPDSAASKWALRELYARNPTPWTVQGAPSYQCSAVSGDGSVVAVASRVNKIVLHSGVSGREIRSFPALASLPTALTISTDLRTIAVARSDGRVSLLSLDESGPERVLPDIAGPLEPLVCVAFSADGGTLAFGGNGKRIHLWDARRLEPISSWEAHADAVFTLAFSRDGAQIASGSRERGPGIEARVWSVPDGALIREITGTRIGFTVAIAFADNDRALYIANNDRSITMVDLSSGAATPLRGPRTSNAAALAFAPDEKTLFTGGGGLLYPVGGVTPTAILGRQRYPVVAAGWPDASTVVVVLADGTVRAIDTGPGPSLRRLEGFSSWCFSVAYSPDGTKLAIGGGDSTMGVFRVSSGERIASVTIPGFNIRTRGLKFLADSKSFLAGSADGAVRQIDAQTGVQLALMKKFASEIYCLDTDPSERRVAVGHQDGIIRVWDIATRTLVASLAKQDRRVEALDFSPDGSLLVSSGPDSAIQLWDANTLQPTDRLPTSAAPWGVVFSPDGRTIIATTHDGTIDAFDTASRTRRATLRASTRLIPGVAFSPDGALLAIGDENGIIQIWDMATMRALLTLDTGGVEVVSVAFDPSGRYLAAGTSQRFTAVYDIQAMDLHIAGNVEYQRARLVGTRP